MVRLAGLASSKTHVDVPLHQDVKLGMEVGCAACAAGPATGRGVRLPTHFFVAQPKRCVGREL
jgi:hypothetical protein